jgi:hypothetical protein
MERTEGGPWAKEEARLESLAAERGTSRKRRATQRQDMHAARDTVAPNQSIHTNTPDSHALLFRRPAGQHGRCGQPWHKEVGNSGAIYRVFYVSLCYNYRTVLSYLHISKCCGILFHR